jgi:excisionase family DNA binding protein
MALDHEILTVKEVGEVLRVNQSTVYKLVRQGRIPALIPAFRIGSDWRFRTDEIARWLAEQTKGAPH